MEEVYRLTLRADDWRQIIRALLLDGRPEAVRLAWETDRRLYTMYRLRQKGLP